MTTTDFSAYIDSLPKVLAGASTLFRDAGGRILIAETTYREDGKWVLPGGTIESADGETPREAARRETLEEVGLDVEPGVLLTVDWVQGPSGRPPLTSYMYDGGVLDEAALGAILLQEEELSAWRMATPEEAQEYLSPASTGGSVPLWPRWRTAPAPSSWSTAVLPRSVSGPPRSPASRGGWRRRTARRSPGRGPRRTACPRTRGRRR